MILDTYWNGFLSGAAATLYVLLVLVGIWCVSQTI